jgi:uncharacterized protein DUF5946
MQSNTYAVASVPAEQCAQCGASQLDGITCRDCFDMMLAFENENPAAFGSVHHLTVACYFLQHPAGYSDAALNLWHQAVADGLDGRATTQELQRRAGRAFAGSVRVRDAAAVPRPWWPTAWPLTVRDVLMQGETIDAPTYVQRAATWAGSVRKTLDAAATRSQQKRGPK